MKSENGRSMVEMLGVLAIIGVLSVGAIAGYSKAMMKYKLNKQAEQLNTVFNAVDRNLHSFNNLKLESGGHMNITSYFIKMGEIPTEMVKNNNDNIYDTFNTDIQIRKEYFVYPNGTFNVFAIYLQPELSTLSNTNLAICQNIITIAKEHADSLYSLQTFSTEDINTIRAIYLGDNYCNGNNCIRDITLNNMYEICTKHKGNSNTGFSIAWHV